MIPLLIAGGVGLGRSIAGVISAGQKARRDRDLLKRAYKIAQAKQEREQGFTRQDTNEELNARGVLNAGSSAGIPATGAIAAAYKGQKSTKTGVAGILENAAMATENSNQRRMALSSTKGETGQANTLSGSVNRDLSGQFLNEQEDLWQQRTAGINATKAQQEQDTVNAIGNGVNTAMGVYNAAGELGSAQSPASAVPGGPSSPVTIRGAFGYDPVDPLGFNKQRLSGFNFNVAGAGEDKP